MVMMAPRVIATVTLRTLERLRTKALATVRVLASVMTVVIVIMTTELLVVTLETSSGTTTWP